MARYGMPYQGSKNSIARAIIDQLPRAHTFIDAFAGGCAITHAALESGKWERYIANDITGTVHAFQRCINGDIPTRTPTRDEFNQSQDLLERLVWSFGNIGDNYLWGKDIEGVKVAAERLILSDTRQERYAAWKDVIKELHAYFAIHGIDTPRRPSDLQGLERLELLEGLQGDYRNIPIPPPDTPTVIYCDPPYRGTTSYSSIDFDFDAFDTWARGQHHPTFISEYTPINGFTVIWQTQKQVTLSSSNNSSHATELLMVQDHYAHHYQEATLF